MKAIAGKVALVTGASSGIGRETVLALLARKVVVYAAARRVEKMRDLEQQGAHLLQMDVTRESSLVAGVQAIQAAHGGVDMLVNNAGYGSYGALEDVPLEEARRQFEVNIFGLARLTQLVLPGMRAKQAGTIVNISSMGGKVYTPFGGWYHATKHALEALSDCLRLETVSMGIDVVIIEPGGINTPWGGIAAENLRRSSGEGPYGAHATRVAAAMGAMYRSGKLSPPALIARTIVKAVTARRPRTRYAVGYMAKPSIILRQLLGDRLFDRLILSQMG